jgi:hypothetical protein
MTDEYSVAVFVFVAVIFMLFMVISASLQKKNKSRE